jgi:hypothetical protein
MREELSVSTIRKAIDWGVELLAVPTMKRAGSSI